MKFMDQVICIHCVPFQGLLAIWSKNFMFCPQSTDPRYLISKFQVIWTPKSHPYPICPISSTSSDLVHKFQVLSIIYCTKILNFQILSHIDHKKSSVPNMCHFGYFQWLGPQISLCPQSTALRYLISKFQVIWTIKSHPYPMCPISSTYSDLVHKFHVLSATYCPKTPKSQILSHMDRKKSSVPNMPHFEHFQWLAPQILYSVHNLLSQNT
jgi:hypothetical protein